jgi:hypothetical protein
LVYVFESPCYVVLYYSGFDESILILVQGYDD